MYQFVEYDDEAFAVEVTKGKYKDCKFLIKRVQFVPVENSDKHTFSYDYELLEGESEVNKKQTKKMDKFVGDLILNILEDEIDRSEEDGYELLLNSREDDTEKSD
tara:strand:- start:734 stop:1048 length:315 start_codon:yes stop_codon:yes gene_type:complete